jgi:hypothetical protein
LLAAASATGKNDYKPNERCEYTVFRHAAPAASESVGTR